MKKFLVIFSFLACFATTQLHAVVGVTIGGAINVNQSDYETFQYNSTNIKMSNESPINAGLLFATAEVVLIELGAYVRSNTTKFSVDGSNDDFEFKTQGTGLLIGFGLPIVTPFLSLGYGSTSFDKNGQELSQDHFDYGVLLKLPFDFVAGAMFSEAGEDKKKDEYTYNYSHNSLYLGYSISLGI